MLGKIISPIMQGLGLAADPGTGQGEMAQAMALQRQALEEIQKLEIPDIEKQKLALQVPSLVGLLQTEELGPSSMEQVAVDPELQKMQRLALAQIATRAESGLTPEDLAQARQLQRGVGAQEQARQSSIMQNMQERGASGAGSELANRLLSSQGAANRALESADAMAIASADAKRMASVQIGEMATSQRGQDVAQQERLAQARDVINQYNLENRRNTASQNLGLRQKYADIETDTKNQEQSYNKGLIQQDFENRYKKAGGTAAQFGNLASSFSQAGQAKAQGAAQEAAGNREILLGGAKMAMGK